MNTQSYLPGLSPVLSTSSPRLLTARFGEMTLPQLFNYPMVSGRLRSHSAKSIGRAGESQTDSLLFRLGLESFVPGEGVGYDRLIGFTDEEIGLVPLATLQIKTTTAAVDGFYRFNMSCGYRGSPQGRRAYATDAFDIAALVILPFNAVYFTAEKRTTHQIPAAQVSSLLERPQESLLRALQVVAAAKAARAQEAAFDAG